MQYRLRVKGQKARYLKASEVAEVRAAIARGKRLQQIGREMQRLRMKLEVVEQKAAELGLDLPE